MYDNIDKFLEDIERLKQKYNDQGPVFTGRSEIISEICQSLVAKAADFLTISSRKETDVSLKKLKEKVEDLEKEKLFIKDELNREK